MAPLNTVSQHKSCKAGRCEFGGVMGPSDGSEVIVVDPTVLDHLEVLFERDAAWIKDVGAVKIELRRV